MSVLIVDHKPEGLRNPLMILAFEGWNDAAESATTAARALAGASRGAKFAHLDPEEFYHFGLTRPRVRFRPGSETEREILWPANEFFLSREASLPRDLIIGVGIEPHLRWRTYCGCILDVARQCGVRLVVTLGALLADVPHTRPIRLTGTASDPDIAARLRVTRTRYEGPTGIVGVLSDACRRAGVTTASLWANVPHYISEVANPHATLALLRRVLEFLEWTADLSDLREAAAQFDAQLAEVVAKNPQVARYIKELEARDAEAAEARPGGEPGSDLPSAGDIIHEVEQFLRQHRRE
jgi:proteasome assembly chaperone (PAC2) family protein